MFPQLYDNTKQHSEADRAELTHCILLQGKERSFGNACSALAKRASLTNLRNGREFLANIAWDFLPAARICPEEMVLFLQSQLGEDWEAGRVAALGLLGALARSDGQ